MRSLDRIQEVQYYKKTEHSPDTPDLNEALFQIRDEI